MAGDWLKMRIDLQSHPKVVRIMSAMRPHDVLSSTDKFRVIGGLHAVWSVFDTHSSDGELHGYTPEALDHIIGWHGFANAMIAVDWLAVTINESLVMPEFSEHNGQSGKRRAEDQKRKREDRKCPQSVRNLSADEPDEKWTREEKRREEKKELKANVPSAAGDHCPHQDIIALYHEVLPQCPRIRDWTPARATQLRARWNEDERRQSIDYWRQFFEYVKSCDFLIGKTDKPFFADLEWLTKSGNFTKVREAKYENKK